MSSTQTVRKVGRPQFKPTKHDYQVVRNLVLLGVPEKKIAQCVGPQGIAHETLRFHFSAILERYRDEMLGKVADKAFQSALKGNPTLMMFVLKTRAGWKENVNMSGEVVIKRVIGVSEKDV